MAAARFTAKPVDETFFDLAPFRLRDSFEIRRPATEIWSELTAENTRKHYGIS